MAFDSVIFFLTLYRAFKIGRGVKLLHVIVRDGALSLVMYYAMVSSSMSGTMYFSCAPVFLLAVKKNLNDS